MKKKSSQAAPAASVVESIAALRRMDIPALVERYEAVFHREPKIRTKTWLERKIAWKLQAGGNPQANAAVRPRKPDDPAVGTTIVRKWHGKDLLLRVTDAGFEFDGVVYKSLSAAAKAATGAHWNGRLFWGLIKREKQA